MRPEQHNTERQHFDEDARVICVYLDLECVAHPQRADVETTKVCRRGRELRLREYESPSAIVSPVVRPALVRFIDVLGGSATQPGDVLLYEHLAQLFDPVLLVAQAELFEEAWARRLPSYECPVRIENGRVLYLHKQEWRPAADDDPHFWWRRCVSDARGVEDLGADETWRQVRAIEVVGVDPFEFREVTCPISA